MRWWAVKRTRLLGLRQGGVQVIAKVYEWRSGGGETLVGAASELESMLVKLSFLLC